MREVAHRSIYFHRNSLHRARSLHKTSRERERQICRIDQVQVLILSCEELGKRQSLCKRKSSHGCSLFATGPKGFLGFREETRLTVLAISVSRRLSRVVRSCEAVVESLARVRARIVRVLIIENARVIERFQTQFVGFVLAVDVPVDVGGERTSQ